MSERHEFQAEVKQLLDLMIHSLYSDRDIFLRELISNASDALDKLRFEQLTRPELRQEGELLIRIEADKDKGTVSVVDNGIGMTREEVVRNIGTIARSGTKEFLNALRSQSTSSSGEQKTLPPELIGQFGVGFYASFMVADRVVLTTRKAGEEKATRWESAGDGSYTVDDAAREQFGTTVTLHLKAADGDHARDYTDSFVIREVVKKYSDFVAYPIRMKHWRTKEGSSSGVKVLEEETLNSMKAIWTRPKSEVSDTEYREFYRHISHDWNEPLRHIPMKIEGTFEANALLYIPSKAPFDLYSPEMKRGVQLYVKRVFVMDECKDLMPSYLRFIKGVVDAHDLSLNVSREILQKDRQIQVIRKQLVKKVLSTLEELRKEDAEKYLGFWKEFGPVIKEGLLQVDAKEKEKLLELVLSASTHDPVKPVTLDEYFGRMKPGQDAIYYLTAPSPEAARKSPLLEAFQAKGYEVLLFTDTIDELWLGRGVTFREKPFRFVGRGEVKLGTEEERKKSEAEREEKARELGDLLTCLRVHLQDEVKEVRLSDRLTSSPVCVVSDDDDLTPQMQRILEQMGQSVPKSKRILELNPQHPLIPKLQAIFAANKADPRLELFARILHGEANLLETGNLDDPAGFAALINDVMLRAS